LSKGAYNKSDTLQVQGNALLGNAPNANGLVTSNAEYAELNIPLLADRPGAKSLSVDVANRWTQFDRSGGLDYQSHTESFIRNSSGRLNIRYQPMSDLLLRASWSQGFRSPAIQSLFTPPYSPGLPIRIVDPCAPPPNGSYNGGALPANCPNGTPDAQPGATVHTSAGNNPNLKAESSISRTFGFVYSPSQLPGLDVNADYYKIEITNVVNRVGGEALGACFNSFVFCNQITTSNNQVKNVLSIPRNFGDLLTEGVDFGVHYQFPSTPFGDFDARMTGTFTKVWDQTTINGTTATGFATSHLAGTLGHPNWRLNGHLGWDYGNWGADYRIEYLGAVIDRCTVSVVEGYCTYPHRTTDFQGVPGNFQLGRQHLGATLYHDVDVRYTLPSINTTVMLGVDNLFDKQPPITGAGGFSYGNYRVPSRLVFGDIRVKF
jgi:iron complex outermembrane receptor protein